MTCKICEGCGRDSRYLVCPYCQERVYLWVLKKIKEEERCVSVGRGVEEGMKG